MRYYIYTIDQTKKTRAAVQRDADILGFSREPTLETGTDEDGTANK